MAGRARGRGRLFFMTAVLASSKLSRVLYYLRNSRRQRSCAGWLAAHTAALVLAVAFNPCFAPFAHAAVTPCCPDTDAPSIEAEICSPLMQLQRHLPEAAAPPVLALEAAFVPHSLPGTAMESMTPRNCARLYPLPRPIAETIEAPPLRVLYCTFLI